MTFPVDSFIQALETLIVLASTSSDASFKATVTLYVTEWLKFVVLHRGTVELRTYKVGKLECVGLSFNGKSRLRGWPLRSRQPLHAKSRLLELVRVVQPDATSFAQISEEKLWELFSTPLELRILHICPGVTKSARSREHPPRCWVTELQCKRRKTVLKQVPTSASPWYFVHGMVRFFAVSAAAAGDVEASALVSLLTTASDSEESGSDGSRGSETSHDENEAAARRTAGLPTPDGLLVSPRTLVGLSLTDLGGDHTVLTGDPMPTPATWDTVIRPESTAHALELACRPTISYMNFLLSALYSAPQSVRAELPFGTWLRTVSGNTVSLASWESLRRANMEDKSGPTIRIRGDAAIAGSPRSSDRCIIFRVRSVRAAVEGHLARLRARGALDPAVSLTRDGVTFLLCGDGAGRRINGFRIWQLAVIPLCASRVGALEAVCPLALAVGAFLDDARVALHLSIGSEIGALGHLSTPEGWCAVRIRNVSDLADATAQYDKASVARPNCISFVTNQTRPSSYFQKRPCPSCLLSAADICAVPNVTARPRPHPPLWRGSDTPVVHRYGRLHAVLHGVPVLLAEVAILLLRSGVPRIARWLCAAFPRTGGFEPHADIYTGEQPPPGSPSYALRLAPRGGPGGRGGRFATERPPHSCRAKDVKAFLGSSDATHRSPLLTRERLSEAPPADFITTAADVLDLLSMPEVPTRFARAGEMVDVDLRSIAEQTIRFFNVILHPVAEVLGTDAGRARWRALGDGCFEKLKVICGLNAPFSYHQFIDDRDASRGFRAWRDALGSAAAKQRVDDDLARVPFHWSRTSLGPAAHVAYQHAVDLFDDLPFVEAAKATEEAFDHFFAYLYVTIPAVEPRPVAGFWSRDAERLWMCVLEAVQVGVPVGARSREIFNSAYATRATV